MLVKNGDYVTINETGEIGIIRTNNGQTFGVSIAPGGIRGSKYKYLEAKDITPVSESDEIVDFPKHFSVRRYGICTSCLATTIAIRSKLETKSMVECTSCMPGWCELFSTPVERDIRGIELKHNIQLLDIYRKENRKPD